MMSLNNSSSQRLTPLREDCSGLMGMGMEIETEAASVASAPYQIHIQESDGDPVPVMVCSSFTAEDVKTAYEVALDTDWRPTDRLLFRQEEISSTKTLAQLGIVEKTRLYVERQGSEVSQVFMYYCSNTRCGLPVYLKRDDIVRCRECNNRIVYKPRTLNTCRYIAR
jgi:DNA-directed RNA polymerase subunit RPC12/RpoP